MPRQQHSVDAHESHEPANPLKVLERAQELIEAQRAELASWIADLQTVHAALREEDSGEATSLAAENDELRRRVAALEKAAGDTVSSKAADDLQAEVQRLQQLVQEKDAALEELRTKPPEPQENKIEDPESFEAELNEFRRQLEVDRQKLNAEIQQVRVRNEELDEATREMEMEMSRERAELARERQRLERLRDEVKGDLERLQRDGGMRESLAPVQRLRDEMTQRRQPGAKPAEEAAMNDRLKSFRNRLSE